MKVVIADLNGDKAKATAAAIEEQTGSPVLGLGCDVTSEADIQACVDPDRRGVRRDLDARQQRRLGEANPDPFAVNADHLVAAYRVNTVSALRMTSAAMPHLRKARNASVTISGSMVSFLPAFDFLAYSCAKAALNHMIGAGARPR